ncbi:outer membrane protein assembly factor BamB family protein [Longispora urticae]
MTVIDLGEITDESAPEPPRRPVDLGWVRHVLPFAVVVALASGVCAAAAGPDRGSARQIFVSSEVYGKSPDQPAGAPALAGDALFTAGTDHLTRHDLRHDGRVVYRVPTGMPQPAATLRVAGGMVFASFRAVTKLPESFFHTVETTTVAFDAGTGARRWTHPDTVAHVLADGRVLFDSGAAVDAATGRELWTFQGHYVLDPDGEPALPLRLVGLAVHSEVGAAESVLRVFLRLRDPETAEVLTSREIYTRRSLGGVGYGDDWDVLVVPGAILVHDRFSGLSRHDPVTLAELWKSRTSPGLSEGEACGRLACVIGQRAASTSQVTAIDPATGDLRWQITVSGAVMADGSFRRLGANTMVLDPDTGRVRTQLTGWRVLGADRRYPDRIPLVRDSDSGGYWLGLLDGPTGRVRLVLPVPTSPASCAGNDRYLACVDAGGRLGAWSYGVH